MKDEKDKLTLSRLALLLFIVGLLGPFLIGLITSEDIALAFGLTSQLLAFVFAVISRQHLFSKVVLYGVAVLALLAGVNYYFFLQHKADAFSEMRKAEIEHEKSKEK